VTQSARNTRIPRHFFATRAGAFLAHEIENNFSTPRAAQAEKFFPRRLAAANSMYPADRACFGGQIDKLSRRAAKTPLTSLLAGIKSATRLIACGVLPDMA
jgi:hypothetical protein